MTAPDHLLRAVGLEPDGPLGPTADGVRLAVRDQHGRRWALTRVAGTEPVARARRRAAVLAAVHHEHLAETGPCLELADGSLAVLHAEVPGADLTTVRRARGAWSPGEVVTVVVPLAEALAALHEAGVAHGDVAPGNVVLRPDGRPVLVDLLRGADPDEAGTPGLAAPERAAGATAASDVYALGRLGALLLTGPDAVGGPGLAPLLEALAAACVGDPALRPSARELARTVYAACPPMAVGVPDAAVLAPLALRRLAVPDAPVTIRKARPTAAPAGRARHRARRHRGRQALVALASGALVAVATAGVVLDRGELPTVAGEGRTAAQGPESPVGAAVRLTLARVAARADADARALAALTVPGSPAWWADQSGAARLAAQGPVGPVAGRVVSATVVGAPGCAPSAPGPALAAAASGPAVARGDPGCDPTARVAVAVDIDAGAGAKRNAVVLVLRLTTSGWRVSAVEPAGP